MECWPNYNELPGTSRRSQLPLWLAVSLVCCLWVQTLLDLSANWPTSNHQSDVVHTDPRHARRGFELINTVLDRGLQIRVVLFVQNEIDIDFAKVECKYRSRRSIFDNVPNR